MEKDAATLNCPNEACQAANPLNYNYCQRCSTPLPKRYLWAVTQGKSLGVTGDVLADRYLIISESVLLDTKPGYIPQVPELEKLHTIRPYLRLFPYRLHVPQVYGITTIGEGEWEQGVLLLEKPPLYIDGSPTDVQLYEPLDVVWSEATSLRQLNWLWQIAQLWQPLASEGVATSLLSPSLLRPEGSLIRLLELRSDAQTTPTLADLGEFLSLHLLANTRGAIAGFIGQICDLLMKGEIHSGEQLIALIDQGLTQVGQASSDGGKNSSVKIVTQTDTGPSRQRNEDACYPPSGSSISKPPQSTALAIVCDGIGGHEGGNVASNLAIDVIQQQVSQLATVPRDRIDPTILLADLERAAAAANDKISQRNDGEGRQGRQRMGTTLVMALPIAHEMYITHVGDSRAYLITKQGCYQVTLDDDVASREVRLGYAVYRDAVNQGASGSLVQALGMGHSNSLHPTAQRFILDEDCIFLLCSDGLSDFDRVEQSWESEILPILSSGADLADVVDKLVEIANTQNGHDNVTIALVYYQTKYSEPETILSPNMADLANLTNVNDYQNINTSSKFVPTVNQRTQVIPDTAPARSSKIPLHLVALLFLIPIGGLIGYFLQQSWPTNQISLSKPITKQNPNILPPTPKETTSTTQNINVNKGSLIKIEAPIGYSNIPSSLKDEGLITKGTTLQVIDQSQANTETDANSDVLHLLVCNTQKAPPGPSTIEKTPELAKGSKVWVKASQLTPNNHIILEPPQEGVDVSCLNRSGE